jgi:hypothetical protein
MCEGLLSLRSTIPFRKFFTMGRKKLKKSKLLGPFNIMSSNGPSKPTAMTVRTRQNVYYLALIAFIALGT